MFRPRAAFLLAFAIAACSAFGEDRPTGPPTGANAGDDAGGSDGSTEAAPLPDGGIEAGSGCGWDRFEDSFERSDVAGPWQLAGSDATNTIELAPDGAQKSVGAKSLRTNIAASALTFRSRFLRHDMTAPAGVTPSCIRTSFALYVSAFPTADAVVVHTIEAGPDTAVLVAIDHQNNIELAEQRFAPAVPGYSTLARIAVGANDWIAIELEVEHTPNRAIRFRVNGVDRDLAKAPAFDHAPPYEVRVGAVVAKAAAATFWIDGFVAE